MIDRFTDWRLWGAWTVAMLATATLFAIISVYTGINQRSQQDLCLAELQGQFDAAISRVVVDSFDKDPILLARDRTELEGVLDRLDHVSTQCPLH